MSICCTKLLFLVSTMLLALRKSESFHLSARTGAFFRHHINSTPLKPRIYRNSMKLFSEVSSIPSNQLSKRLPHIEQCKQDKHFNFQVMEKELYDFWNKEGFFSPDVKIAQDSITNVKSSGNSTNSTYVVPMPPPNVTGFLHIGHALFVAIQDILVRFHRMRGETTLWLPGTDHAGIATQSVVEKMLQKNGVTREALGREKFLDEVWKWKQEKGDYILEQMKEMGASADWTRQRFTLDDALAQSVTEAFVRLHDKGLIYRGEYLVNWSPTLQTAVSDLEVDHHEEPGRMYYFKYLVDGADSSQFIPVATTRPETVFGDTAVCVHPEDKRYAQFIGKFVRLPVCNNRLIPVIADSYVNPEVGTGALKVTPGHDPHDYEIGLRHNLPMINVMNKNATLNELAGGYKGLDRFECRKKVWGDMQRLGLALRDEQHLQRVPRSQRSGEIIEPMLSKQWFVKTRTMAERASASVREKLLTILPDRFEKTWFQWLDGNRDWCISRQLWWGHRIPVYYVNGSEENYVVARNDDEAMKIAKKKFGDNVKLRQDEDVLDTWFRSLLFLILLCLIA